LYQNLNGNGVGENTRNNNEKGILSGFVFKPYKFLSLAGYFDKFVFPYLKYQVNTATYGSDFLAQINYTPSKKTEMYARVRKRLKQKTMHYLKNQFRKQLKHFKQIIALILSINLTAL
jgi:hypothetical protein